MNISQAIRITEILLAIAFIQQSLEHMYAPRDEQKLFFPRLLLSLTLLIGISSKWLCLALTINSLLILKRFEGPYNGGSDRMGLLILVSLTLIYFLPGESSKIYIFTYLSLQVILSYLIPGFSKIKNSDWRNGIALRNLFLFSAYPINESLREIAKAPSITLKTASWFTMVCQIAFPLALINQFTLIFALIAATVFHLVNIYLFGFNRFFWVWLAAYPNLIWFQTFIYQ